MKAISVSSHFVIEHAPITSHNSKISVKTTRWWSLCLVISVLVGYNTVLVYELGIVSLEPLVIWFSYILEVRRQIEPLK
jgi:hypothetical protein